MYPGPVSSRGRGRRATITLAAAAVGLALVAGAAATAGDLDPMFGDSGTVTTDLGGSDLAAGAAVQTDGKIVVAGSTTAGSAFPDFAVARYEPDGTLDSTFGAGGTAIGDLFSTPAGAHDVVLEPDGKILAVGGALNFNLFALVRYNPSGTLDASFGSGGKVTLAAGRAAFSVALQPDGKIVVAGDSLAAPGAATGFALARFDPDGTPDPSFDGDGRVETLFTSFGGATSVVVQVDLRDKSMDEARRSLAARQVWERCRDSTSVPLNHASLGDLGDGLYAGVVRPALTDHDRRRLRGCLEDATLERVSLTVVGMGDAETDEE